MSGEQTFWERRRAKVAAEEAAEQVARDDMVLAEEQAALDDMSDAELLATLDLPDPDTLKMGDDFSAFMSKAVPDRIRRRALRTLWRSNPVLANVDMLVDYGEDFTDSATVIENMQTAYQVGKGMLKHVEEMARQAAERENPAQVDDSEIPVEDEDEMSATAEDAVVDPDVTPAAAPESDPQDFVGDDAVAMPRRMKFRIEETA